MRELLLGPEKLTADEIAQRAETTAEYVYQVRNRLRRNAKRGRGPSVPQQTLAPTVPAPPPQPEPGAAPTRQSVRGVRLVKVKLTNLPSDHSAREDQGPPMRRFECGRCATIFEADEEPTRCPACKGEFA